MINQELQEITGNKIKHQGLLLGKTLYIPRMSYDGAMTFAAAYRAIGVNGQIVPEADAHALDLARQYTIGEECFPEIVTLGAFLKIIEDAQFDPEKTAFMMPTAGGPCRFGQYKNLLEKILREKNLSQVKVVAPTSADGYEGFGESANILVRLGWWAVVCSDALRKLLLQTRPYEVNIGETERVHAECLDLLCGVLERQDVEGSEKFDLLVDVMSEIGSRFDQIERNYSQEKPLIGVIGEIYCRLDDFTNADLIKHIEKFGGEVWLAAVSEWVFYTNFMQKLDIVLQGNRFSKSMLGSIIRNQVQIRDEHRLLKPIKRRLRGYEEKESIKALVQPAESYLPYSGALGEMVLNVGGAIHFFEKGADGVIDISPFTCMNGTVCEAVYPRISRDHDNIPIRIFYFDGTEVDHDRDIEIFLELAYTYKRRKKKKRVYPSYFPQNSF